MARRNKLTIASYRRVVQVCALAAIAIGVYSRFSGLGVWPLTTDEYFIVRSVDNILQHGIPEFNCGGYYMRGLTLQYLIASLLALGTQPEFAARLVPALCSLAVLPAVYLLGKRLSGAVTASICVALLSLSLWEIEFARFARMYMPFQAIFVWYLLVLQRVVVDKDSAKIKWLWLLSVAGVLTWAGGLFLFVLNFLPTIMKGGRFIVRDVLVNAGLLGLAYFYSAWNFRFMGAVPPFPPNIVIDASGQHLMMPKFLVTTVVPHTGWLVGSFVLAAICVSALVAFARIRYISLVERLTWAALVVLSFLNLFGCVVLFFVCALLFEWVELRRISIKAAFISCATLFIAFVFWLLYAASTTGWYELYPGFGPGGHLSKLAVVLFKYPDVFDSVVFQWIAAVPKSTAVLFSLAVLAGSWSVLSANHARWRPVRLVLAGCIIMSVLGSLVVTTHVATRYSFYLLPILYLIAITVLYELIVVLTQSPKARGVALSVSVLLIVAGTEDFGWAHMIHIDSARWNYRLPLKYNLAKHFYPRFDYRTTAQYVNNHATQNDLIITMSTPVSYYLTRTDYVYRSVHDSEFASIACDRGERERWSGSRLIYREVVLKNIIDKAPNHVWVVANLQWRPPPKAILKAPYAAKLMYRGREGHIAVYQIAHE